MSCRIDQCDRKHYGKGLCKLHWRRMSRTGSPEARQRPTREPTERFWSKVDKTGGPDSCWPWMKGCSKAGYGVFRGSGNVLVLAHRWALEEKLGRKIGVGLEALHGCDNPPCVNPAHLREGTRQQNVDDAVARGRQAKGRSVPSAKLSEDQVLEIRSRLAAGERPPAIADAFGVSRAAIHGIRSGRTWRHLENNMSGVS